jgi:hypothetical protein
MAANESSRDELLQRVFALEDRWKQLPGEARRALPDAPERLSQIYRLLVWREFTKLEDAQRDLEELETLFQLYSA